MVYVHEIELTEVISRLPGIMPMKVERDFADLKESLFLCTLGFEDRCPCIPALLADDSTYRCDEAIYFEYSTNREDNEINREKLVNSLHGFATLVTTVECDSEMFPLTLRQLLTRLCTEGRNPSITFDISVCSSKLLLTVIKILLEFDVRLRLVYSEAEIYHPTKGEIEGRLNEWIHDEELGLTRGVANVFPSREHPGYNVDNLPEAIIAFAPFKPDRTEAIVSFIDETLLETPEDRVIWIVGIPHYDEGSWRIDLLKNINSIPEDVPLFNVSAFDYRETLKVLNKIWKRFTSDYHLNVSPLGSKMQSLGIALFHHFRPDVTIVFAPPKEYNASHYSEGCKGTWKIDFGNMDEIRSLLDSVGTIEIKNKEKGTEKVK
jgi:hypothetical protein